MIEMEQCKETVETETARRHKLEEELEQGRAELRRQIIIGHHGDQERKRLETLIEAVGIINPKQVEHLQSLQLAFQFKPRKVIPSDPPLDYIEEELSKHDAASIASGTGDVLSLAGVGIDDNSSVVSGVNTVGTDKVPLSPSIVGDEGIHADNIAFPQSQDGDNGDTASLNEERDHFSLDGSVISNASRKEKGTAETRLDTSEINSVLGCEELSKFLHS